MKKLVQINTVSNTGSTGRIMEDIGSLAQKRGWESYVCYGRYGNPSTSKEIKIGTKFDNYVHVLKTRLFDAHGLASKNATKDFLIQLDAIKPDIVHLHNLHGYYINIMLLFDYLAKNSIPVVWTLHDCWAFTGHCVHFTLENCYKWKTECHECPQTQAYPKSYYVDRSKRNFHKKKEMTLIVDNLTIVPVSKWLSKLVKDSFLQKHSVTTIYNGINHQKFHPKNEFSKLDIGKSFQDKFIILGVAGAWNGFRGLDDFIKLSNYLKEDENIILVGLGKEQKKILPEKITGILKTESVDELAELYSMASVYVNLTYGDTFPTTNLEALSCGTPVITYRTGGSPEAIDEKTGHVVEQGNIMGLLEKIRLVKRQGKDHYAKHCLERSKKMFNKNNQYLKYFKLYEALINKT